MIDFMVIGLPRSGTAWAANWLTTDFSFCIHDPLNRIHYSEWDIDNGYFPKGSIKGVSCTGIWRWPEFVNSHPAKKLILRREFGNVQDSLWSNKLEEIEPDANVQLSRIEGLHIPYEHLFDPTVASTLWTHLLGTAPHNLSRHANLRGFNVQQQPESVRVDRGLQTRLHNELLLKTI